MTKIKEQIQEAARTLLAEGKVDYFLGYAEENSNTFPVILPKGADVSRLTFNRFSYGNLANHLPEVRGAKVAIVCKQCDMPTLNVLAAENQIRRADLVVVGVPCPAMLDPKKITAVSEGFDNLDEHYWQEKCRRCEERNTPGADIFVGEKIPTPTPIKGWPGLEEVEKMSVEERRRWWHKQMELCIRCYACRLACPLCYCHQCFVEDNKPQWLDKSVEPLNNLHYHLIRAVHLAGRCIECEECSRVCPVGIPVDLLNNVLTRDFAERFKFHSGASEETKAALITFDRADPEDFIL